MNVLITETVEKSVSIPLPFYSKHDQGFATLYYAILSEKKILNAMIGDHANYLHCSFPSQTDYERAVKGTQISREEFLEAVMAFTEKVEENFDELRKQIV